jgi:DNA polymerase-3 subunit epsilon
MPITEAPLAFVDLEMTGLDPKVDRVIEVAVSRRRGAVVEDAFDSLVNPGPEARFNTDVHGLGPAQLANAPPFSEVAGRILETCSGAVLIAHGAWWDVTFLESEFARLGKPVTFPFYLDTVTLSRRAIKADSHSLEALARRFAIDRGIAHRAKDDVRSLVALFDRLLTELRPASPRDLWHVRIAERHARPEIVERCVAFAGTGAPARILYRPSHKPPRAFEAILTEVRTDLDPPRVLGYSLPGRGRFDLRSDRILAITHTSETVEPAPS